MSIRAKRVLAIVLSACALVIAAPPLVAEALYLCARPSRIRETPTPIPRFEPAVGIPAFWLEAGEELPVEADAVRPWRLAWPFILTPGVTLGRARGARVASMAARASPVLDPTSRGVRWHATFWATAVWISGNWTAAEMTQAHIDGAYYGRGATGLNAASMAYFGKRPNRLEVHEIALLVALTRSPTRFSPDCHPGASIAARDGVLDRLRRAGVMTREEHDFAVRRPLGVTPRPCD